ncbi:MAG: peptidase-C39 like family protein [Bdellovibrionota bacterium]
MSYKNIIPINMLEQPDDSTCGPVCLHSVYRYLGIEISLEDILTDVISFKDGGTLAVYLGIDALERNLNAELVSYNLEMFDPTWSNLNSSKLIEKLTAQKAEKCEPKFIKASDAYIKFLTLGGKVLFKDLSTELFKSYFDRNLPILTGLSATYLYYCSREYVLTAEKLIEDDIKGRPVGHFVVLNGMEESNILVADPYKDNPYGTELSYSVSVDHLMHSILLGAVTYDANLLVISKE